MGFWSGFEGLTGHKPGAFKGFSLKDIIDKDLWERRERKFPSPRYAEEGLDAPTTAWYKGMGRPEMMGPRVGAAGVTPVDPAAILRESPRVDKTFPPFAEQHAEIMRNRYPGGQATVSAARPWANIQAQKLRDPRLYQSAAHADRDVGMGAGRFLQLGDPRNIRSGPDLPPASGFRSPATGMLPAVGRDRPFPIARRADIASQAEQDRLRAINSGNPAALRAAGITPAMGDINREPRWIDKTTTVKESAAVDVPNTTTTVYKEKVQPASIMNMGSRALSKVVNPVGNYIDLWGDTLNKLRQKRYEDAMRARRGY